MNPTQFISILKENIIEDTNKTYQKYFDNAIQAKDPVWNNLLLIYNNCTNEQKKDLLCFFRMLQVNTLSHILGVLDGSTFFSEENPSFILKDEKTNEVLNGDLQDIFLEMEE